jgi:hypothetical protein
MSSVKAANRTAICDAEKPAVRNCDGEKIGGGLGSPAKVGLFGKSMRSLIRFHTWRG